MADHVTHYDGWVRDTLADCRKPEKAYLIPDHLTDLLEGDPNNDSSLQSIFWDAWMEALRDDADMDAANAAIERAIGQLDPNADTAELDLSELEEAVCNYEQIASDRLQRIIMDIRQLILDRLEATGRTRYWLAELADHSLHPHTVYRYLRADADLTGKRLAELMTAVGLKVKP